MKMSDSHTSIQDPSKYALHKGTKTEFRNYTQQRSNFFVYDDNNISEELISNVIGIRNKKDHERVLLLRELRGPKQEEAIRDLFGELGTVEQVQLVGHRRFPSALIVFDVQTRARRLKEEVVWLAQTPSVDVYSDKLMCQLLNGPAYFQNQNFSDFGRLLEIKMENLKKQFLPIPGQSERAKSVTEDGRLEGLSNRQKLKRVKTELADPKMFLSLLMSDDFEDLFQSIVCSHDLSLIAQTIKVGR